MLKAASDREKWDATKSYSMVKLMGIVVMQAVARGAAKSSGRPLDPKQPGIIVNAVCPGLCKTDLGRKLWYNVTNFGVLLPSRLRAYCRRGLTIAGQRNSPGPREPWAILAP